MRVVLVHGFLANPAANVGLRLALRRAGYETIEPELPGLGTRPLPETAAALAAFLRERLGRRPGPWALVGVSLGGVAALKLLRRQPLPRPPERFVAIAAPFGGSPVAARVHRLPWLRTTAAPQLRPGSPLLRRLTGAPPPVPTVTISVAGDPFAPPECVRLPGALHLHSPHGRRPLGHYEAIFRPANLRLVVAALRSPLAELRDRAPQASPVGLGRTAVLSS